MRQTRRWPESAEILATRRRIGAEAGKAAQAGLRGAARRLLAGRLADPVRAVLAADPQPVPASRPDTAIRSGHPHREPRLARRPVPGGEDGHRRRPDTALP